MDCVACSTRLSSVLVGETRVRRSDVTELPRGLRPVTLSRDEREALFVEVHAVLASYGM